jgi:hypothetical protein
MQAQVQYMKDQVTEWSEKIRIGALPRHLVAAALMTTITKMLQYPLAATTLSEKQCTEVMKPLLKGVLPRTGYTFPRTLVYAHTEILGLEIPNLYWIQGLEHIERLVRFEKSKHLTGKLIRQSLEAMQLEVGISQPV